MNNEAPGTGRSVSIERPSVQHRRVLLIEPDPSHRATVLDECHAARIVVDVAVDSGQALELISTFDYGVVLIASPFSVMLGQLRCIRSTPPGRSIPIVACVDELTESAAAHVIDAGATDVAGKPMMWVLWRRRLEVMLREANRPVAKI